MSQSRGKIIHCLIEINSKTKMSEEGWVGINLNIKIHSKGEVSK
jgi:hypothetical protein